jgi:hypothetical protein
MVDRDQQAPVFGEQGEPCQECGALLAADQRYCLNCGKRRAGPRVDYQRYLAPSDESAPPQLPEASPELPASEPAKPERDYAPFAAVGGIAVLGLMLLVGVLIGKGNNTTTAAPAPVIRVGGEAGSETTAAESEGSKTASAKSKGSNKSKKGGTGAKTVAGGLTGTEARSSKTTVQATTDDLEELNNKSGDSYQDAVKKLPDKIATPGAPPPVDKSTAPGGGGKVETIE